MSVTLTITNQTRGDVDTRWLARQFRATLKMLAIKTGEWSVTIVNDRAMAALHQQTMNLASTTDVLTFNLSDGAALELDTVVCRDEAIRRAREMRHAVREELLLYAVHSLLHVQGYYDITAQQAARMHRREDAILLRLGVGAVYAGTGKTGVSGKAARKKSS